MAVAAALPSEIERDHHVARLQEELANRDEIIVALQHVIRDLRHEVENLHAERAFALARDRRR